MHAIQDALQQTILDGYKYSLNEHTPISPYQAFHIWALSNANPHYDMWINTIGIPQFAKLTQQLLDGLVCNQWDTIMPYARTMNNYLIHETVSDNLAIGLAGYRKVLPTGRKQKIILHGFNQGMIHRLDGEMRPATELLNNIEVESAQISYFDQSLTAHELFTFAKLFEEIASTNYFVSDIEYGVWPALVANIESCYEVVEAIKNPQLKQLLQKGLVWRYQAVEAHLKGEFPSKEALIKASTEAILVFPVLLYYISVVSEIHDIIPELITTIENGLLEQVLYDAALLVRLLNDIGTTLLLEPATHQTVIETLEAKIRTEHLPFADLLLAAASELPPMTRINKDLRFGEWNICLYDVMQSTKTSVGLSKLRDNLSYFSNLYQKRFATLYRNLGTLTQCLDNNEAISTMIMRFVKFHEYVYKHAFDTSQGDYATTPTPK